jgi:hypothetical protein
MKAAKSALLGWSAVYVLTFVVLFLTVIPFTLTHLAFAIMFTFNVVLLAALVWVLKHFPGWPG